MYEEKKNNITLYMLMSILISVGLGPHLRYVYSRPPFLFSRASLNVMNEKKNTALFLETYGLEIQFFHLNFFSHEERTKDFAFGIFFFILNI